MLSESVLVFHYKQKTPGTEKQKHLKPYFICRFLVVSAQSVQSFLPKPKVIQMLSFHDCGHTGKQEKNKEERCMFFFIISKIDDDFSNIGYNSATRVFACLIHMSNCSNCTCSLGNFVCKCWVGHITRHSVCSVIWFSTRGKFVNKLDVQLDAHFTCWGSDPTLRSWAGPGTMQNAI